MMMTQTDLKAPNEDLYTKIQEVYSKYFYTENNYTCSLAYSNVEKYGLADFECSNYHKTREYNADGFVLYTGTHWTILH